MYKVDDLIYVYMYVYTFGRFISSPSGERQDCRRTIAVHMFNPGNIEEILPAALPVHI